MAWAEPLISAPGIVELPDGRFHVIQLIGLDHATLVGRPPQILEGNVADLRLRDSIFVEIAGLRQIPGVGVGDTLRIGDCRARVVGICRASEGILAHPQIYTTVENARRFLNYNRSRYSAILVKLKGPAAVSEVRQQIRAMPDLTAFTADEFRSLSKWYIVKRTAIGLNFALTVTLGLIIGLIVSTAAFSQFIGENLPHFALLKAVGTRPAKLIGIVLLQAAVAGLISYGIGIGLAGLMVLPGLAPDARLTAAFPWQLMVGALVPMLTCISVGSIVSLRKVIRIDPVILFQ